MNKLLITGCLLATAFAAVAMPNKKELAAAQKRVEDIIAPDVKALNVGRKTVKDVADAQMKLAADAQSEAEKYLLLQSAFKLYSRGEEFDSAAKALTAITRDIKDVPPELITELVDKEFNRGIGLRAPREVEMAEWAAQRQQIMAMQEERETTRRARPLLGGQGRPGLQGGTLRARRLQRQQEAQTTTDQRQATVDGYTWTYRVKNGEAEIVAKKDGKPCCAVSPKLKGHVAIPLTLGGAMVTSIGNEAFRDCKGLVAVTIPPSVTNIGAHAFSDNSELMSFSVEESNPSYSSRNGLLCNKDGTTLISGTSGDVKIPPSVTSIRENAFYGRHGLNALTIPPTVREIGNEAFESCRELAAVTLPSSVVRVGRGIFADCTGLKQIDVEEGNPNYTSVDGVLYTKDRTELWMWPAGQRRVTIPDHVRVIGQWAFLNFDGLTSLTIPSTVTSIGWGAFQGCDGLTSVTIPSSVGSIDGCAFRMCGGLTSVTMEEGITNIGRSAFCDCSELKSVKIPLGVTRLDSNVFRGCRELTSVVIPSNVTSIGWCAFCDCSRLKSVTIPSGVTSIGGCAFFRCGELTSVPFPRSVTSIGKDAFYGCGGLSSVTMLGERPSAPNNIFPRCGNLKSIHVPANAKSWAGMTEWQGIPLVFDAK